MTRGTAAGSQRSEKERYSDSWQTENATSQNTVPLLSPVRPPACHESKYRSVTVSALSAKARSRVTRDGARLHGHMSSRAERTVSCDHHVILSGASRRRA